MRPVALREMGEAAEEGRGWLRGQKGEPGKTTEHSRRGSKASAGVVERWD